MSALGPPTDSKRKWQLLLPPLRAAHERLRPALPGVDRRAVRRVCVVLSGSRSGSSYLFKRLSRHLELYSPGGEETPFYRMLGLGFAERAGDSDALGADAVDEATVDRLGEYLLADSSVGGAASAPRDSFAPRDSVAIATARALAFRFLLQWPELLVDETRLVDDVARALREHGPARFLAPLLARLRVRHSAITPSRYDGGSRDERAAPRPPVFFLEEPPFVAPAPRTRVTAADLRDRTLLLKSSSNAYRVPLLRRLFPNAEYRFIFLSRNPAGAVSGLIDGWLSSAFHSHALGDQLDIAWPARTVGEPGWWKFDLPPGWARYARAPLAEICAFQWRSANAAILDGLNQPGDAILRLRYEGLLSPEDDAALARARDFLGIAPGATAFDPGRPVMAVHPPGRGKWKTRRELILPLLAAQSLRDTAQALGYDLERVEELP